MSSVGRLLICSGTLTLRNSFVGQIKVRALLREILRYRILAVGIVFLITAFLLALFSIYPEYHTYSYDSRVDVDQEFWGPVYIQPPDFQNQNLLITESRLSLVSNVNLTVKVYSDETLLALLDMRSEQSRSVDLNRETSVLMLNGTSMGIGEVLLSYKVVGYALPWNMLGIPASILAIFGAAFAIRGYTMLRRESSVKD